MIILLIIMLFIFFILFVWFIRLVNLAADCFLEMLSTKQTILAVLETIVFILIVFNVINYRFTIEDLILNLIKL